MKKIETSWWKTHINTQKLNWKVSTIIDVLLDQKRAGAVFTMCLHTFTFFWLRKTSVINETYHLNIKLLSGLDGHGLWLIIHLLNVDYVTSREKPLLRMPLTECGETLSRPQPRPSSPNSNFMHNAGRERLRQFHIT